MKQEKITSIQGDVIYTAQGQRRAIGNADHKIGDWVWVDGMYVFGTRQQSSNTPYIPADTTECILELIPNADGRTYADVIAREIRNDGSLHEIGRVRLKFDLTTNNRARYSKFVYDKDSMFFVNASDGLLREYKKITQSEVIDITVQTPNGNSPGLFVACPSIRVNQGWLTCILPKVYGDVTGMPEYGFNSISNMYTRVMEYNHDIGNYTDYPILSPNDICIDVGCDFDEFKRTLIPYASTYRDYVENGIHSTFSYYISYNNEGYQLAKERIDLGDYTAYPYQYNITVSDKYTVIKNVDPFTKFGAIVSTKLKNNATGIETKITKKDDLIALYGAFYPPAYKPFINIGKKHTVLTDFANHFGKQRFVLEDGIVLWSDTNYTNVSNMDSPIITKTQAKKLLDALKNMEG